VDYKARKAREWNVRKEGTEAAKGEVKHMVGAEAHQGVDQRLVNKRKKDN